MSPRGLTAKGKATRRALLEAAGAQLAETGAIDVAHVGRRAGVAPSVLYRYFSGRHGLVAAVVGDFYDRYDQEVFGRDDLHGERWVEREALRIEQEVAFFYTDPLGRAVACGTVREPAATQVDVDRTRSHVLAAARNIRAAQRTGELPAAVDADLAAAAIIGTVRTVLAQALSAPRTDPADVVALAQRVGAAVLSPPA